MSTHNIGFYEEISKIITYHQISSNTHLISSAAKILTVPKKTIPTRSFSLLMILFCKVVLQHCKKLEKTTLRPYQMNF